MNYDILQVEFAEEKKMNAPLITDYIKQNFFVFGDDFLQLFSEDKSKEIRDLLSTKYVYKEVLDTENIPQDVLDIARILISYRDAGEKWNIKTDIQRVLSESDQPYNMSDIICQSNFS